MDDCKLLSAGVNLERNADAGESERERRVSWGAGERNTRGAGAFATINMVGRYRSIQG